MKRRTWILSALGATGALVVGWGVMPARSRLGSPELMLPTQGDIALNGWIKIAADGAVVMAMPRSEMGQGVHTSLAMLVAEELDVRWGREVDVVSNDHYLMAADPHAHRELAFSADLTRGTASLVLTDAAVTVLAGLFLAYAKRMSRGRVVAS